MNPRIAPPLELFFRILFKGQVLLIGPREFDTVQEVQRKDIACAEVMMYNRLEVSSINDVSRTDFDDGY